jgi:hypothetical protein
LKQLAPHAASLPVARYQSPGKTTKLWLVSHVVATSGDNARVGRGNNEIRTRQALEELSVINAFPGGEESWSIAIEER